MVHKLTSLTFATFDDHGATNERRRTRLQGKREKTFAETEKNIRKLNCKPEVHYKKPQKFIIGPPGILRNLNFIPDAFIFDSPSPNTTTTTCILVIQIGTKE